MNIIKRIGVALNIAIFDALTENQAKQVISEIQSEWWTKCPKQVDPQTIQELQRRSEKLAYIEGVGYELKQPTNPSLAAPVKPDPEPKEPRHIDRNNRRGSVQDAVVRCIDNIQTRYYTSTDVWREYQLMSGPKTTRATVLACVTYLRENGIIHAANPPRKLGTKIVHQK